LLDIGSGGGLTLAKLAGLSNCKAAIGIEVEEQRHIISSHFNRSLIKNYPDMDIPLWYVWENIIKFPNFNGFSKIFMYDAVFTPDLMEVIAHSFNQSSSVKTIVASKNLVEYGFDVKRIKNLGSILAKGGKMSHTFYAFQSRKHCSPKLSSTRGLTDPRISNYIMLATKKEERSRQVESFINDNEKISRLRDHQIKESSTFVASTTVAGKFYLFIFYTYFITYYVLLNCFIILIFSIHFGYNPYNLCIYFMNRYSA